MHDYAFAVLLVRRRYLDAVRRFLASPGFKFFLICGLILVLLIPLLLVWALVSEREQRADSVRQDVARAGSVYAGLAVLVALLLLIVAYRLLSGCDTVASTAVGLAGGALVGAGLAYGARLSRDDREAEARDEEKP